MAELFPEIITPLLDTADDLPSCSAIEALERQEPFINQTLAYHALAMLARLFRRGEIPYYGGFVNLATGKMAPLPVERRVGPLKMIVERSQRALKRQKHIRNRTGRASGAPRQLRSREAARHH